MFHTQIGEVWSEVCAEIKEEFRPVTADEAALKFISSESENTGKAVAALQTEMLEIEQYHKIQEDEEIYNEVRQSSL